MLELDGLRRRFGATVALDSLSFKVPPGQVFGFLGPNGAGKTTAMRAIFGLISLDAGEVRYQGQPITDAMRRTFGYLPEERGLYPAMVVREHLVYLGRLHGLRAHEAGTRADHWLDTLGIADRAGHKVQTLSLGNQQRVQLAAALLHEPGVLVLDEPFSGLDPVAVDLVSGLLTTEAARGATVVFSSHQLDLVETYCDSVAIIDHGRLLAEGTVEALTRAGGARLVVRVDGDQTGAWANELPGVTVSERHGATVRLRLDDGTDPQQVLVAAQHAGPVTHFAFERRRLSEVFREAVGR